MEKSKYELSKTEVIIPKVPVGITGVGSYLPPVVVRNDEFTNLNLSDSDREFMETKSGIKHRHWARNEDVTSMAVKAGWEAMKNAGVGPMDVDMVVVTHITRNLSQLTPPNSVTIQTQLGALNATAINIDQGFTGWMYALMTGASYVASGFYKTVLVVSGESILPHTDSTIMKSMLVGDGAGAFVLQETESGYGLQGFHLMSEQYPEVAAGVGVDACLAGPAEQSITQKAFFNIAPNSFQRDLPYVKEFLPFSVKKVLKALDLSAEEIEHYILAQKFDWLNRQWADHIGIDYSKVHQTLERHACMETASIPVITDDAVQTGKLKRGDLVVFADLGSNWSVASAVFRWCCC
ncbi:3-oxoacyl-ACP synthase III family protein [Marinilabilia sp.]|uniref:3-oxoacyl-ACP synthase III family protein n=1 Tax=Marinilabilia sp. TaxID=2021252 RepID=UPI0025C2DAAB|nr:ketoacyl-ACP synthase III [Marinilabilia sp.]